MNVLLNGNEGEVISFDDAKKMHENYSSQGIGITCDDVKSLIFGRDHIEALINKPDCSGIRIYFGLKKSNGIFEPELMLVAINSKGEDILTSDGILSDGVPCPKICPVQGL